KKAVNNYPTVWLRYVRRRTEDTKQRREAPAHLGGRGFSSSPCKQGRSPPKNRKQQGETAQQEDQFNPALPWRQPQSPPRRCTRRVCGSGIGRGAGRRDRSAGRGQQATRLSPFRQQGRPLSAGARKRLFRDSAARARLRYQHALAGKGDAALRRVHVRLS